MKTDSKIRNQIIRRIQRIPSGKLNQLNELLLRLEKSSSNKAKTLSFAGAWSNLDSSTLDDLTTRLLENRQRNRRRYE